MAEEFLESNIVIATKFLRPQTGELLKVHGSLLAVENRLKRLTDKPWIVRLEVDDSALQKVNLALQRTTAQGGISNGNRNQVPGQGQGPLAGPLGNVVRRSQTVTTEAGLPTGLKEMSQRQVVEQGILRTETEINNVLDQRKKTTVEEVNLLERASVSQSKRLATESAITRLQQQQQRLANAAGTVIRTNQALRGLGLPASAQATPNEIAAYERRAVNTRRISEDLAARASDRTRKEEEQQREKEARVITASRGRTDKRDVTNYMKELGTIAKQSGVAAAVQEAIGQGFQAGPSTRVYDVLSNSFKEIHNLTRVAGDAFRGYRVEVLTANEATGKLNSRVLEGSQAMKFLGDNTLRAVSKVLLWSVATAAVFGTIRAIQTAGKAIIDLEEDTALLARVGSTFAGGGGFEARYESAKKLTDQILELTTVYGGNAKAALEAASIFARAGKDEQETLKGVRVALLAARIAEIGVVDAAKFAQSAMSQFKLSADELLPTLDSLNTLSNNYRVTTKDLYQAISRTGAVFAEHNGRLSELASITAVLSENTARSGAEIGNALKTITSNLDRLDVQKEIFAKMGISTIDFSGRSKSLSEVILELRNRMDQLSTSQQKQLLIQIAGVRQANFLQNAISDVVRVVEAENKVLLTAGSAQSEFTDRAFTMQAALERISATLIQISTTGGGGILSFFTSLVNITDQLLRLLTVFKGVPLQAAVMLGGFLLIQKGIDLLITRLRIASVTTTQLAITQQAATASAVGYAASQNTAAVAVSRLGVVQRAFAFTGAAFTNVLKGFFSASGLITAAVIGITYAWGKAAEAQNTYIESVQAGIDASQADVQVEQRRQQAIKNSTTAIADLINTRRRLIAEGNTAGAVKVANDITRISGSAGIGISNGNVGIGGLATAAGQAITESRAAEKAAIEKRVADRESLIQAAQDKVRAAQGKTGELSNFSAARLSRGYDVYSQLATGGAKSTEEARQKVNAQYAKAVEAAQRELNKLTQEQAKDAAAIASQEAIILDLKTKQPALDRLSAKLAEDRLKRIKMTSEAEAEELVIAVATSRSNAIQEAQYTNIVKESDKQLGNLNKILDLTEMIGTEQYEEAFKEVNKLLEDRVTLYKKLQQESAKSVQGSFGEALGLRNRIYGGVAKITSEKTRGLSDTTSPYGNDIAQIDIDRQQQLERIKNNKAAAAAIPGLGLTKGKAAGAAEALNLDTQEALNKLKDLEADKVLAILEAEKNIALERKKSADEAGRALGALSSEDKLRARAVAGYFKRNPGKKLSFEEQFNTDAATNRIIDLVAPGRKKSLTEDKGALAELFKAAGVGLTPELGKGEAEVAAARGGRTDADLIKGAMKGGGGYLDMIRKITGAAGGAIGLGGIAGGVLGPGAGRGTDTKGGAVNKMEIGLKEGTFDFTPLTESFREVVQSDLKSAVAEMRKDVQDILAARDKLNARRRPTVSSISSEG